MKIETERLIIDEIKESDKRDYFTNISHDKKVLETFICKYVENFDEFDFSPYVANDSLYAIRLKETGRLVGIFSRFDETARSCEIGYGLGSSYWGKGYATEATKRFLEYLFESGFQKIYASFFVGNDASKRVLEKCGLTYDHFNENELTYLDLPRDLVYYSIEKS